jgi:hypothetical protein
MAFQVTEVQRHLKGASYPSSGGDLAQLAQSNGADDELVDALRGIGGSVDGPNEVMKHLSGDLGGSTGGAQDRSPRSDVDGPAFQVDDVQRYLKGAEYPSSGSDLAKLAKGNGAPDELVDLLGEVGKANGPTDVMQELEPHLGGPQS